MGRENRWKSQRRNMSEDEVANEIDAKKEKIMKGRGQKCQRINMFEEHSETNEE